MRTGPPPIAFGPCQAVEVTDGLFTVLVNDDDEFGGDAFMISADERWLQIEVKPSGPGAYGPPLTPRQRLTPSPLALLSLHPTSPFIVDDAIPGNLVQATKGGTGGAGSFITSNPLGTGIALSASTESAAPAIEAITNGTGLALRAAHLAACTPPLQLP